MSRPSTLRMDRGGILAVALVTFVALAVLAGMTTADAPAADLRQPASAQAWTIECVDCPRFFTLMGQHSLRLDAAGHPRIAYGGDHLYYAWYDGAAWHTETADNAGSVGRYASLALDATGHPHISYYDLANKDLKYARWTGTAWSTQTVDSAGDVGQYAALALDAAGNPHIGYYDNTKGHPKYAAWTGSAWTIQTVDSAPMAGWHISLALDAAGNPRLSYSAAGGTLKYAAWTGTAWMIQMVESALGTAVEYSSLALDTAGNPHISYHGGGNLKYARWTGSAWAIQTVESAWQDGLSTALALEPAGNPVIAYYDPSNRDLKYARWTGTAWTIQTVESAGEVGRFASLALDGAGNPQISYFDDSNFVLKHARWSAAAGSAGLSAGWMIQTVDHGGSVGESPSLAIDTAGQPHLSYYDVGHRDLKYARRNGAAWTVQTVDSAGDVGQYTSLALNAGGAPHIGYYDGTNGDVKLARWTGAAWAIQTVESAGVVGQYVSLALDAVGRPRLSYYDATNGRLKYAAWTGTAWDIQAADSSGNVGGYTSLALDAAGAPHIAYYDEINHVLKYARWTGSTWSIQTVDSSYYVGAYASLAVDAAGNPRIAYFDMVNGRLKYARWTGTAWDIQVVDSGGAAASAPAATQEPGSTVLVAPASEIGVGLFCDLVLDGIWALISYYDGNEGDLKLARETEGGWESQVVEGTGDVGRGSSVVVEDDGDKGVGYRDEGDGWLKYGSLKSQPVATATPTPTTTPTATPTRTPIVEAVKSASPAFYPQVVAPGEMMTYTISLLWDSSDGSPALDSAMSDAIPRYSDYVPGSATANLGQVQYQGDADTGTILWGAASVPDGFQVVITFKVLLDLSELPASRLEWPARIENVASGNLGPLPFTAARATFIFNPVVNTTGDTVAGDPHDGICGQDGTPCSLREAIAETNYHPNRGSPDVISFNIPTAAAAGVGANSVPEIMVGSALPTITDPVVVDGVTQPDGPVVLSGKNAGPGANGLSVTAAGSSIKGLVIRHFKGDGVSLAANNLRLAGVEIAYSDKNGISATGDMLRLEDIKVHDNALMGISAEGTLMVTGTANQVSHNRDIGIRVWNGFREAYISNAEVYYNKGEGIRVESLAHVNHATVSHNGDADTGRVSHGLVAATIDAKDVVVEHNTGAGIYGSYVILSAVTVRDNAGAGVHGQQVFVYDVGNQVSGNGGSGIEAQGVIPDVEVAVGATLEVRDNGAHGISADGKVVINGSATISHNGCRPSCPGIHIGHGIYAPYIFAGNLLVQDNNGYGLWAVVWAALEDVKVLNNAYSGIKSGYYLDIHGEYNEVSGNNAYGIETEGDIEIEAIVVRNNGMTGIKSSCDWNSSLCGGGLCAIAKSATVSNNGRLFGGGGIECRGPIFAGRTRSLVVEDNKGDGVSGSQVDARQLVATYNGGYGIRAATQVVVKGGRICNNGRGGVYAGGPINLDGIESCKNQGHGVHQTSPWTEADSIGGAFSLWPVAAGSTIVNSMIISNTGDGIRTEGGASFTISQTNVMDNAGLGVNNLALATLVDARANWWGDPSGPGGVGPGSGDEISGNVAYTPWLTHPVALVVSPSEDIVLAARGATAANPAFIRNWLAPTDTVTVTLTDALGWLVGPTAFTVALQGDTGTSVPVSFTVPVSAALGVADRVSITAVSGTDPSQIASTSFEVIAALLADLELDKSSAPEPAAVGRPLTYTLLVANTGPDAATGVILTDTLPAGAVLVSVSTTQGSCGGTASIVCNIGAIQAGGAVTATLVVVAPRVATIVNEAAVTAVETDPAPWDNRAVAQTATDLRLLYLPVMLRRSR